MASEFYASHDAEQVTFPLARKENGRRDACRFPNIRACAIRL